MRPISVSTDVFARIWSLRGPGEESEDSILRRVLERVPDSSPLPQPSGEGFYDVRHRVAFPGGFEVFRTYRGTAYRARARGGRWVLASDGRAYGSLNELSRAIGARTENAWINWFFFDDSGQRRSVSDLRDSTTVLSRRKGEHRTGATERFETHQIESDGTWRDDVRAALEWLGGRAHLGAIYEQVQTIRGAAGRSIPPSLEAVVRRTLEDHSSDSEAYRGVLDLFCMAEGKGAGVWALREREHQ